MFNADETLTASHQTGCSLVLRLICAYSFLHRFS